MLQWERLLYLLHCTAITESTPLKKVVAKIQGLSLATFRRLLTFRTTPLIIVGVTAGLNVFAAECGTGEVNRPHGIMLAQLACRSY